MNLLTETSDPGFFERVWQAIVNFFNYITEGINSFLYQTVNIDGVLNNLYDTIIGPLPELVKILITLFGLLIFVFGIVFLFRKMFKFAIVLIIVLVIIYFIVR